MMLSRTASNLYWIGRYMERAEFTTRLVEATVRLGSISLHSRGDEAWQSALAVVGDGETPKFEGESSNALSARHHLTLSERNPSSIRSCLASARGNARAARNLLTREVWEAINRSWTALRDRPSHESAQATLSLAEEIKAETRGFEGALVRMLRSEAYWFMRLGSMIERGDNTARLLDVKYYLLLPEGAQVGGIIDRDQWTTMLQTVSGQTAYRMIYKQELRPWLVADLLIFRPELPRSLTAVAAQTVTLLGQLGSVSGRQGPADRLARRRLSRLESGNVEEIAREGMHEFLQRFIQDNAAIGQAIAAQFRFS